ncbi:HAD-superfamily subfamily IIA hydrolase, TIGR01457 [Anaerobranca californiensis DSM 14826]|uniref:Acid sugar phosphatase n=1 Tax=Anaerobranca californiensis DSM 14826 TaxID=1120989 RepID=A0A1M6RCU0_9FIRM|nr:HAD-IIA family hydrolase [Anaerobranca californiensis]SHK30158.1 HAD-superfamily subfamily IIA hydrolase, TIGR01457 [Anaerobranca californiensis DSM 14826]
MLNLKKIKHFLLDMDGTFYLGNNLIDGSLQFLSILKEYEKDFLFLTNNSSKNSSEYKKKLNSLGCIIEEDKIFTSGEATAIYLNKRKKGAKVYLLGTHLLEEEFLNKGFHLVKGKDERPDFVVLGFDTTLTYEKVWIACDFIRAGVEYIATHPDYNCPLEGGKYMPDTGAMIKMIEASTGKLPKIIGKPNKYIIEAIIEKYNLNKEEIAIVGDRLYTDIKLGINAGITSILVLSGETTKEMYEESNIKADYIFPSIKELGKAISTLGE